MLAKRIVPCLDIKDGKTVKGINFVNFRDAGDPVELGAQYSREGADELVYLDITASHEGRKTFTELVKQVAAHISIPFTVGGGINELKTWRNFFTRSPEHDIDVSITMAKSSTFFTSFHSCGSTMAYFHT